MENADNKSKNIAAAVEALMIAPPAVARWGRMANVLSEALLLAAQQQDLEIFRGEIFRKAIGYLSCSPKRVPHNKVCADREWKKILYFSSTEAKSMSGWFAQLLTRLDEWATVLGLDEEECVGELDASEQIGRQIWQLVNMVMEKQIDVIKTKGAGFVFRPFFFRKLSEILPCDPILPSDDSDFLEDVKSPVEKAQADSE